MDSTQVPRHYKVDAPLPKTRRGARDEIEYWAIHVNDGQQGSEYCLQVESRLTTLRHLEQAMMHDEKASITNNHELPVFISHSSQDEALAAALIDLLESAIGLVASQIRCSSVDGYRLPVGVNSEERLREEVNAAKVVIGLVTPNSLGSDFVMFELGARWGSSRFMAPLLAGVKASDLKQPLNLLNTLSAHKESQLCQLVEDIGAQLGATLQSPASYLRNVTLVKQLADATRNTATEQAAQMVAALQQENSLLVGENAQLTEKLRFRSSVQRIAGHSYADGDNEEICSRCAEVDLQPVHLLDLNIDGRGKMATCPQCKTASGSPAPPISRKRAEEIARKRAEQSS